MSTDTAKYVDLLCRMIATPSLSRSEEGTAALMQDFLEKEGVATSRCGNNVYARSDRFDAAKPTLLLNSHHDTVKPASGYSRDPFTPTVEDGRIYGLGSNDAGASAVTLTAAFMALRGRELPVNLMLALTAEEEVGGEGGMRKFLPQIESEGVKMVCAIVGEPTGMQPAVAERGLVVLDAVTEGVAGHAARGEGINAIYRAIADIEALRNFRFPARDSVLGPATLAVTQIQAGTAHNAVPDECRWVVDIRTTDQMTNEEVVETLRAAVSPYTRLTPRSTRIRASVISEDHPLVRACTALGKKPFVSPTTSDMSLMHGFPSLKIGPGESKRSHSADEYVLVSEIDEGIDTYIKIIEQYSKTEI